MSIARPITLAQLEQETREAYARGLQDGRAMGPESFDHAALEAASDELPEPIGNQTLGARMEQARRVIAAYFESAPNT